MTDKPAKATASRILLSLASLVVVIAGLQAAQSLILPILLAFFIASASFPITRFLRRIRIPRSIAVLLTVMIDFGFLVGIGFLVNYLVVDLQAMVDVKYQAQFDTKWNDTTIWIREHWGDEAAGELSSKVKEYFNQERLSAIIKNVLGVSYNVISSTFIILILLIFMLSEARMFQRRLTAIFEARGPDFQRMVTASRDIQRYLGIKTLISLSTGILAWGLCELVGLDFGPLWGILAFFLNYIPAIGSIVAGVPPVLLAVLMHDWKVGLFTALGYLAINGFLGNFLEPMLLGRRFGLSTLVILISVIFWGWLWGPLGMLLAVPLTMILKVGLDNNPELRWLSIAMSKEKQIRPSEARILEQAGRSSEESKVVPEEVAEPSALEG